MKNVKPEDTIEYGYLNVDQKKFYATQPELVQSIGSNGFLRAIPNYKHGQVLIAGTRDEFSDCCAIIACRRLTGMYKNAST